MTPETNLTEDRAQAKAFVDFRCSPSMVGGLQPQSIYFSAAVYILLSITTFLGNSLILVALHKESALHAPSKLLYRCLATTDLLVGIFSQPIMATYWMLVVQENWSLCRYASDAAFILGYTLCGVSLSTMTAISVDRLLALLLGLRYKQIVTLKRTYLIVATFWVTSSFSGLWYISNYRITLWLGRVSTLSTLLLLLISIISYTKIFRTLSRHQAEVQHHFQQQPSQPNALNLVKYRKALYSALWVQIALVLCYLPFVIMEIFINPSSIYPSHLVVYWEIAVGLVQFNSILNPFLYCWKIREVRQAVKQTIRQALWCPWS